MPGARKGSMLLLVLAFAGGVLTILSPCILPVLPFVFASADRPFARSGLPMLIGMAVTFAIVATLAAVGGAWIVRANEIGRDAALVLLALFAASLLSPRVAEWTSRPFVRLGSRLSGAASAPRTSVAQSFALGVATGLLWGAVRRSDPRFALDRRSPRGNPRRDRRAAPGVRGRSGDVAGHRGLRGQSRLRRAQAFVRHRGVAATRDRRRRPRRGGRHCLRSRSGRVDGALDGRHLTARTGVDRSRPLLPERFVRGDRSSPRTPISTTKERFPRSARSPNG